MFATSSKTEGTAAQAWDYLSSAMASAGESAKETAGDIADKAGKKGQKLAKKANKQSQKVRTKAEKILVQTTHGAAAESPHRISTDGQSIRPPRIL